MSTADVRTLGATDAIPERRRGQRTVWSLFRRHRLAVAGMVVMGILIFIGIFAPLIAPHDPNAVSLANFREPPTSEHLLGTDAQGRDVLSRIMYATRISLSVGLVAVAIYVVIGTVLGGVAGFFGGWVDSIIMRLADVILSFPAIIVIITVVSIIGPSIFNVMLVIGLLGWPPIARLVRGEFLTLRGRDFVTASESIGASSPRIIFRHILPNATTPIIVNATFGVAQAILLEAGLSFLGLGVQPPTASWGNILNAAQSFTLLEEMPWLWLPPGFMIVISVLAINFLGDGLRDALDPRARR
ncbi:MAG TPA: oligopeptide ABC transporter permease [Thermomicrobiales bacterium]|jgi:peptide/nickel transport system permease protein|nr:oligopeptide ABC transporter permease [Thermomicrobiales bacterium]